MKKHIFYAIAMSLALVACNKEQEKPEETSKPEAQFNLVQMQFTAGMEGAPTKTTLDDETGAVSWANTDAVAFYWEINRKDDGTKSISSATSTGTTIDGTSATFTAGVPEDFGLSEEAFASKYSAVDPQSNVSRHMYAVYPSGTTVDYSTGSSFYVTIPSEQDGSFASASIAVAKWAVGEPLQFNNLCGLLQITVADNQCRKIVLTSDADIAGKMNVTFPKEGDNIGKPIEKSLSDGVSTINVNVNGSGTYYVALRPVDVSNLYVALYDEFDVLLGDNAISGTFTLGRKKIVRLGTVKTGFGDRFYVKADGTGNGTSWDDAAPYSGLAAVFAANTTKKVFMAAGEYTATQISPGSGTTSAKVSILGGYPADASGYSIAGRNPKTNQVVLNAGGNNRIWILQRGHWTIDGITFKNAYRTGTDTGSALVMEMGASTSATTSFTVRNCTFEENNNEGSTGGGAVRVSGTSTAFVKMVSCTFKNNTATAAGGAVYVNNGTLLLDHCVFDTNTATTSGGAIYANNGKVTAVNCDFENNVGTTNGGAIVTAGTAEAKLNLCTFRTNSALGTGNGNGGGAAWVTGESKFYANRCFFANNTDKYNAHAIYSGTSTWVGLNNCVVRGPYGSTTNQGSLLQLKGFNVVVNTNVWCQTGSWGAISLGSKDEAGCRIINSIVLNTSSSAYAFYCTTYYMQLYNTIHSAIRNPTGASAQYGARDPESTCLQASARSGGNFPTSSLEWGYNGAMGTGTRFDLDGDRYIYVYPWEGTTDAGTVNKNNLSGIKTLISDTTNIGSDFLSWLEGDDLKEGTLEALAMDIRGKARNTSAMWPGSYEDYSAPASIQSFNLK